MKFLIISILILLCGATLMPFIKKDFKLKICTIFTTLSSLMAIAPAINCIYNRIGFNEKINILKNFGDVYIGIDLLSSIFVIIIALMSLFGIYYANGYLKFYIDKNKPITAHCSFLMILIASMLSVVISNNVMLFLISWEIMSLSSFFLVLFEGEKKEVRKAATKYLIYMHLSIIFIIAMMILLTNASNSYDFNTFSNILQNNKPFANIIFMLGFTGFGIKAGFVPFHNWLPDAHPAAPSHVSGLMSGIMIKTGIYGILRVLLWIGTPSKTISYFALIIAIITVLYGVLYAITQHDIKRLLAYSSIENIGIIGTGIAVGMLGLAYNNSIVALLGFSGGILHVLNHSIFKQLLFMAAGNIYHKTHTKNIEYLGGLIKTMPYTSIMFIIGSLAISGLPLFNGFISELLIYAGMLTGIPSIEMNLFIVLIISIASLALAGTMAIVCFSKASGITLLGEARSELSKNINSDVSNAMLIPMGILSLLTFILGIFPQFITSIILSITSIFIKTEKVLDFHQIIITYINIISFCLLGLLLLILIILAIRIIINKKSSIHNTWGCGYNKPNSHMQYTPSSYDNLFVSTLKPLFKRVSHIKKPKDLFPKEAYFELEIEDIEEAYIVEPIIKLDEKLLTKFERIQNGNMQQYILFGLIFLVLTIIGLIIYGS